MSALTDALAAARTPSQPRFERWLTELDPVDREALLKAAPDTAITTRKLYLIIQDAGCRVGRETVLNWRKAHGFDSR